MCFLPSLLSFLLITASGFFFPLILGCRPFPPLSLPFPSCSYLPVFLSVSHFLIPSTRPNGRVRKGRRKSYGVTGVLTRGFLFPSFVMSVIIPTPFPFVAIYPLQYSLVELAFLPTLRSCIITTTMPVIVTRSSWLLGGEGPLLLGEKK